jgi:hypothetical protein
MSDLNRIFGRQDSKLREARNAWRAAIHEHRNIAHESIALGKKEKEAYEELERAARSAIDLLEKTNHKDGHKT